MFAISILIVQTIANWSSVVPILIFPQYLGIFLISYNLVFIIVLNTAFNLRVSCSCSASSLLIIILSSVNHNHIILLSSSCLPIILNSFFLFGCFCECDLNRFSSLSELSHDLGIIDKLLQALVINGLTSQLREQILSVIINHIGAFVHLMFIVHSIY